MVAVRGLPYVLPQRLSRKDMQMFGAAASYVVAISTLLFCAASALTLFNVVEHFDPPAKPEHVASPADFGVEVGGRDKVAV